MAYKGLLDLHNLLRWIILILLVINIVKNYANARKPFTKADEKLGFWLMICVHTTLILGLIMWVIRLLQHKFSVGFMQNSTLRNHFMEHPIAMLVAVALITIGKMLTKKNIPDEQKHKRSAHLYLLALIIILAMIPWATSSLIPGM
jgi:hypothetical protein